MFIISLQDVNLQISGLFLNFFGGDEDEIDFHIQESPVLSGSYPSSGDPSTAYVGRYCDRGTTSCQ